MADFFDVKHFAFSMLEMVDYVQRLAVSISGYGVGEVHTGASEGIGRMVNKTVLHQGQEPMGIRGLWGRDSCQ